MGQLSATSSLSRNLNFYSRYIKSTKILLQDKDSLFCSCDGAIAYASIVFFCPRCRHWAPDQLAYVFTINRLQRPSVQLFAKVCAGCIVCVTAASRNAVSGYTVPQKSANLTLHVRSMEPLMQRSEE